MAFFVVMDEYGDGAQIVGLFSTRENAEIFVAEHKDEPHSKDPRLKKYEWLRIEEHEPDSV